MIGPVPSSEDTPLQVRPSALVAPVRRGVGEERCRDGTVARRRPDTLPSAILLRWPGIALRPGTRLGVERRGKRKKRRPRCISQLRTIPSSPPCKILQRPDGAMAQSPTDMRTASKPRSILL